MLSGSATPSAPVSDEGFSISTEVRHGCRILSVEGDLDDLAAPELDVAIGEQPDAPAVVVDLSGLSFIASAGIHVLLRERPGGCPAVVCPPGHVARVLAIVDATRSMRLFEDVDTAVEAASARARERADARQTRWSQGIWPGRSHEKRSIGRA
jgi:anti-anti-sigma factor